MKNTTFEKVSNFIKENKMISKGDKIVLGVSGGADSVCLLFLLYSLKDELDLTLYCVHVNHGIREEASEDALFVENKCKSLNIPFFLVEEDVPAKAREWKLSDEEAGRRIRYEAFEKVAAENGCKKIAVAHNQNDDAETILFHMFRGTGLQGLTGIPSARSSKVTGIEIIRPILSLGRDEIEDYLREKNIDWVVDKTNLEDEYSRNKIRLNILTEAEKVSPGATRHICESAAKLLEIEEFLEGLESEAYERCLLRENSERICFSSEKINKEPIVIVKRIVFSALKQIAGSARDIGTTQVDMVMDLIQNEGNRSYDLNRGVKAYRSYDNIILARKDIAENPGCIIETEVCEIASSGFEIDDLIEQSKDEQGDSYIKWLDCDKIDGQISLRKRESGDYIYILGNDGELHKKTLKEYMINCKIPAELRGEIPVLAAGKHCVYLAGYRISDACRIDKNTKNLLKVSVKMD